jgi:hypothetical protein
MSKLGMIFLMLASMTLAWAGPGAQGDDKTQPCKVTTKAGSHPCTAEEEAALIAKQRHALEGYQPHASGQPYTKEEQGRALLRLLGPGVSPAATPFPDEHSVEPAAEKLKRTLHDAVPPDAASKAKPSKQ